MVHKLDMAESMMNITFYKFVQFKLIKSISQVGD